MVGTVTVIGANGIGARADASPVKLMRAPVIEIVGSTRVTVPDTVSSEADCTNAVALKSRARPTDVTDRPSQVSATDPTDTREAGSSSEAPGMTTDVMVGDTSAGASVSVPWMSTSGVVAVSEHRARRTSNSVVAVRGATSISTG